MACVLARTSPGGGARGFSLFLADRRQLPDELWRPLPKVRTHGIRGADISGFTAIGAVFDASALVGEIGDGIPVVLKTLQLTRIACAGLSLGAADHALRIASDFASERRLYGRVLADVPYVRRILGRAAAPPRRRAGAHRRGGQHRGDSLGARADRRAQRHLGHRQGLRAVDGAGDARLHR
jgi:alkylation response protein AidB-like acyl-CoA dehydrogenase